ncbi:uncharacterized protein LOC110738567 [Chenopodium quinoa]|uniref:uncharacterized protein LOC110738567 n=1 Tax=Chenopodium quinoa TaxID=63459 RepID=UPI000B798B67|nr:uncharacterized protein LOC110738567 [Chenopodium quinoa]
MELLFCVTLCLLVVINSLTELKTGAYTLRMLLLWFRLFLPNISRGLLCFHYQKGYVFFVTVCLLGVRVSHKKAWGIDWKALVANVANASFILDSRSSRCLFSTFRREKIEEAQAAYLFWRQRAKVKWDAFVDEHTRLLFSAVQARRRKNTICGLKDNDGSWVSNAGDIRSVVLDFYKLLYSRNSDRSSVSQFPWDSLHLPSLSDGHRQSLLAPFSAEDIRQAMFSIANGKSPGPDGFTSAFFKTYWTEVGDHVVNVVQFFFVHGYLLKDWNRTFLVFLPKVDHPELVSQFRPIGLCNVIYKCIAKCLARRLRWILPDIVSDFQNAFVPGRLMSDNCLMVHEILSFINASKARKLFYATLKLDMNKAYDRVEWDFLSQVLQVFGFPPYWVHLIMQCVSTVSYQVLVNGSPTEGFRPQRGLCQRDPLSSYLFVLCMEVLSAMLRKAESEGLFQGIKIARRALVISHLFFADDSLLFFQVSPLACEHVMNVLSALCDISGQMLNLQKSFVKFSPNTPEDYRAYLFVVNRLQAFAALQLSPAAKLVIINSVLVASFNHILSVFKIPDSICSRMDNLLARFWWKSSSSNRGLALRSSSLLHLPKGLGGLGIRSIAPFNSSLLAKQSWRFIQCPQLLVSRLLFAKYPALRSIDSISVSRPSWGYRSFMSGFSVLSKGMFWKVLRGPFQFKDLLPESVRPTLVSSLLDPRSCAWNATIIHGLFDSSSVARILSLDRPLQLMDDFVYWKFTRDGVFSTKSAYALFCEPRVLSSSQSQISPAWWRKFWALPILPRWKIFGWKLLHDALPLATTLHARGLPIDPVYAFCYVDVEYVSHTFRDCPVICSLWLSGALGIQWDLMQFPSFGVWFSCIISHFSSLRELEGYCFVICSSLGDLDFS